MSFGRRPKNTGSHFLRVFEVLGRRKELVDKDKVASRWQDLADEMAWTFSCVGGALTCSRPDSTQRRVTLHD